jgi:signal transduction histidine kinase
MYFLSRSDPPDPLGRTTLSPFVSIFPDLEEVALRRGLRDLLAGKIDRFKHAYVADTPLGPRSLQWNISLLRVGAAIHFLAAPEELADAPAVTTALVRALREAVAIRTKRQRHFVLADANEERRRVCITPIRLGRRTHLLAFPDDPALPMASSAAERLLLAQEEERHRVALELHDSTSQHLVAIGLGLTQLRRFMGVNRAEGRVVEDMSRVLQDAIREIRTFSYLMNPPQLERDRLEAATRRFVAGFESRTGVKADLTIVGRPDDVGIVVQHTLFRVLQETLTRIFRQAKAAGVTVRLARRGGWVTLTIADDAPAQMASDDQPAGAPIGVGVAGMRAPVTQLGGSLRVTFGPEGGRVIARLPTELEGRGAPQGRRRGPASPRRRGSA